MRASGLIVAGVGSAAIVGGWLWRQALKDSAARCAIDTTSRASQAADPTELPRLLLQCEPPIGTKLLYQGAFAVGGLMLIGGTVLAFRR